VQDKSHCRATFWQIYVMAPGVYAHQQREATAASYTANVHVGNYTLVQRTGATNASLHGSAHRRLVTARIDIAAIAASPLSLERNRSVTGVWRLQQGRARCDARGRSCPPCHVFLTVTSAERRAANRSVRTGPRIEVASTSTRITLSSD